MTHKESVDKLVARFSEMNYGDMLDHCEISNIIGYKYRSAAYKSIVRQAQKILDVSGHMIVSVPGIGYKVCHPDNYTREGVRYVRQGARRIDKGTKIINHAPVNDMSPTAREIHNRVNDRMLRLQAAMAGASTELHMLSKPTNPLVQAK